MQENILGIGFNLSQKQKSESQAATVDWTQWKRTQNSYTSFHK